MKSDWRQWAVAVKKEVGSWNDISAYTEIGIGEKPLVLLSLHLVNFTRERGTFPTSLVLDRHPFEAEKGLL